MDNSLLVLDYLKKYKRLFSDEIFVSCDGFGNESRKDLKHAKYVLNQYETLISNCQKCQLSEFRKNFVFGYGDPEADLVLVGEAPGSDEDEKGLPFIGKSGRLLDKILNAIGLNRYQGVFILNLLKCRPPKNRDPLPSEIEKCSPYLKEQIKIIKPKLIVALGKVAGKYLIGKDLPLKEMRGVTHYYHGIPSIVTYHPAALLRNQSLKKPAWDDFKWVKNQMKV